MSGKTTTELQTPTTYDDNTDATDGSSIYETWNTDVDDGLDVGVDNGTAAGDPGIDDPWDFGTDMRVSPALKVDFDRSGTPSVVEFGTQPRTAPATPVVSSFTPTSGAVSATVMIIGIGFSTTAGDNTVTFLGSSSPGDEQTATVSTASATELTVTVPSGAVTGRISVTVGGQTATSSTDFTVLISPPDTDADGLIDITTLARLDAIRYDLNGDGMVDASASMADSISYETAFGLARKGSITCTGGCSGYELRDNLDFEDADGDGTADDKSIWAEGASGAGVSGAVAEGWAPIGYFLNAYTATFDGRGHTISNLYINRPSTSEVGLFGVLGTGSNVRNLGIEGGSLSGNNRVGGLVGNNSGTISACYTTGDATGNGQDVGGLVGYNSGTISACYATGNATGNATGTNNLGGLVGYNDWHNKCLLCNGKCNGDW